MIEKEGGTGRERERERTGGLTNGFLAGSGPFSHVLNPDTECGALLLCVLLGITGSCPHTD